MASRLFLYRTWTHKMPSKIPDKDFKWRWSKNEFIPHNLKPCHQLFRNKGTFICLNKIRRKFFFCFALFIILGKVLRSVDLACPLWKLQYGFELLGCDFITQQCSCFYYFRKGKGVSLGEIKQVGSGGMAAQPSKTLYTTDVTHSAGVDHKYNAKPRAFGASPGGGSAQTATAKKFDPSEYARRK